MGASATKTLSFSLLALFLVCATLATVNGNKFKWFKTENAEDCKKVDENDSSLEKDSKPSSKDCTGDGKRFCFCAKIRALGIINAPFARRMINFLSRRVHVKMKATPHAMEHHQSAKTVQRLTNMASPARRARDPQGVRTRT